MREVKYIVPEQVKDIHVPQKIIDTLLERCKTLSLRDYVVFLGNIDGYLCFAWEWSEENFYKVSRYARSPVVSIVDSNGVIEDLSVMPSIKIMKKAVAKGIKEVIF